MRFLADMGVAGDTVAALRAAGHDVVHARDIGSHTRPDSDLLGDILPSVIVVRTQNQRPAVVTPRVLDVAERFAPELDSSVLIVIEDARFRFRRLPLR